MSRVISHLMCRARAADGFAAFGDFGAQNVFGTPVAAGGRTVIPCAAFDASGGWGGGSGGGDDGRGGAGSGSGFGFGGRTQGHPVAIVEITDDGVRVRPVFDWTRLGVVAITTAFAVWRRSRR